VVSAGLSADVPSSDVFSKPLDESLEGFKDALKTLGQPIEGIPVDDTILMEGQFADDDKSVEVDARFDTEPSRVKQEHTADVHEDL